MAPSDGLPLRLAIRMVMGDVWYSNALPDWYTPEKVDRRQRLQRLTDRVNFYERGDPPLPALKTQLPRLTGGYRPWFVPAVNDQIIMQACVTTLVPEIAKTFDHRRVYSHVPNDENNIAFIKPQIPALLDFYAETVKQLKGGKFVLEFDIERAFASIDRDRFFQFLEQLRPKSLEVRLIRRLLDSWSGREPGVPLINDSVFFLGGAYLAIVDREVSKTTTDYIRYVDDYRVFGGSQAELETIFEKISRDVAQLGLKMNPTKVRIGSAKEMLDPEGKPRFVVPKSRGSVVEFDSGLKGQLEPGELKQFIGRSLEQPDRYLTEGIGRYLLGTLRRYRLSRAISRRANEPPALADSLVNALTTDPNVMQETSARLKEYGNDPSNSWRAIWIIYLIEQQGSARGNEAQLTEIEANPALREEVRLWARRCRLGVGGEPETLDDSLHDLSYLDAGRRCYGDLICKGEGF